MNNKFKIFESVLGCEASKPQKSIKLQKEENPDKNFVFFFVENNNG